MGGAVRDQRSARREAKQTWAAIITLILCAFSPIAAAAPASPDEKALQAHMEFLASDLIEGRESGTRGYDISALYVASQFRTMGLKPAGTDGYRHVVPLRISRIVPGSVKLRLTDSGTAYTDEDHVLAYPSYLTENETVSADAVFAGAGVVEPKYGRDDYAGLDVDGKIVVVLGGRVAGLPPEVAVHLGAAATQATRAQERGAKALIVIYTPALERRWPFVKLGPITRQTRMTWLDKNISPLPGGAPAATAFVDEIAAEQLFAGAPASYQTVRDQAEKGAVKGFALGRRIEFSRRSQISEASSANVAGLIPGSDPAVANQVIVVTAHLDHVGIGPGVDGDTIYNGAIDNASGIATTLEVARLLATARPKRSVLFLATTAEEKGLIGADYFARAPTVNRERIVAAINIDGVMAFYDFKSVIGYGVESSTLSEPLDRAARSMGLSMMPDPKPAQSIFTQSDHYPFVKQGIPAVFLQMGEGPAPDGSSGLALADKWDDAHLHKPSDDLNQRIDYKVFARFTELYRRFILESANMASRPRWRKDDFFGDTFARCARPDAAPSCGAGK
jgi:hypothetical protein